MVSKTSIIPGKATICVVNYRTLALTRLCLRSIRKFTRYPHKVLVVDNDSQDASVDYLRGLTWIHLLERRPDPPDRSPEFSHGAALDLGLENCHTEFFVSLHSDTVVLRANWLRNMIAHFRPNVACVGGRKLEFRPRWQLGWKRFTDLNALKRRLFWHADQRARYRCFNRTVCSAYKTDILQKEQLSFRYEYDRKLTVGHKLYSDLKERGYDTETIPDHILQRSLVHLVHATQVINPGLIRINKRVLKRSKRNLKHVWESDLAQTILADESLDQ